MDVSLSIPSGDRDCTLTECFRNFTNTELISDASCEKCAAKRKIDPTVRVGSRKRMTIIKTPQILCIHMRRLVTTNRGNNVKVHSHVSFTEEFDLAPFCSFDCRPENLVRGGSGAGPTTTFSADPDSKFEGLLAKTLMMMNSPSQQTSGGGGMSIPSTSPPKTIMPGGSTSSSPKEFQINGHLNNNNNNNIVNRKRSSSGNFLTGTSPNSSGNTSTTTNSAAAVRKTTSTSIGEFHRKGNALYRLISVIVHHGNASGGHYTTFRRILTKPLGDEDAYENFVDDLRIANPFDKSAVRNTASTTNNSNNNNNLNSSEWVHISDQNVRSATLQEVLASQAYILYYERM